MEMQRKWNKQQSDPLDLRKGSNLLLFFCDNTYCSMMVLLTIRRGRFIQKGWAGRPDKIVALQHTVILSPLMSVSLCIVDDRAPL